MNIEELREEGVYDPVGTIRACESFGTIAFYIKVAQNRWRAIYVDPEHQDHLIPDHHYGDSLASIGKVVFVPKHFEPQYE